MKSLLAWTMTYTSILAFSLAVPALAQEPAPTYSLLALERVSVAAQVGYRWEGLVNGLSGVDPVPVIRLAPVYALFGKPGKSQGSVAVAFPVTVGLDSKNRVDFGVMLSVMLFDGSDK
jgi:hypothetical protein